MRAASIPRNVLWSKTPFAITVALGIGHCAPSIAARIMFTWSSRQTYTPIQFVSNSKLGALAASKDLRDQILNSQFGAIGGRNAEADAISMMRKVWKLRFYTYLMGSKFVRNLTLTRRASEAHCNNGQFLAGASG